MTILSSSNFSCSACTWGVPVRLWTPWALSPEPHHLIPDMPMDGCEVETDKPGSCPPYGHACRIQQEQL